MTSTSSLSRRLRLFLTGFALWACLGHCWAELAPSRIITVKGESFPLVIGQPLERFSLVSVHNGRLNAIPYQIDDMDVEGGVYIPESGIPVAGREGRLDEQDEILFMLRDAGPRKKPEMPVDGTIVGEIATQADGQIRFVYLVADSRLRTDAQHVRYSADLGHLETDYYSLSVNPDNALLWDDFQFYAFTGTQESPLDTMKLRMRAGFLLPFLKVELDNKNFVAKTLGTKVGPIRATAEYRMRIFFMKVPMLKASVQAQYSASGFSYLTRMDIPKFRRKMARRPSVSISMDGNQLMGAEIITPYHAKSSKVDGQLDQVETVAVNQTPDLERHWILVRTHDNLDIFATFEFQGGNRVPLALYLKDDANIQDKPERFRGQLPNIGWEMKDLPGDGRYQYRIDMMFNNGFEKNDDAVVDLLLKPPIVHTQQADRSQLSALYQ